MAKIQEKTLETIRKALRKAGETGLDAKGLMKATKLDADTLKPAINHLVNELEEVEVDGKIMTLALEADEAEAEAEEEDEDEIVPARTSKKAASKGQSKPAPKAEASKKGQKAAAPKAFSMSYGTLDTLDEDELNERIEIGVKVAQALNTRGGDADVIAAELIMRSVGKCRKMLRKLNADE